MDIFVFFPCARDALPAMIIKADETMKQKWLYKYLRCEKKQAQSHNLGPFSHTPSGPIALHYPDE